MHNDCRSQAVKKAWKQEQENALKGEKLSRDWSQNELKQLKSNGHVKGYEGHHINSVNGHEIMAGDPNNIMFVIRKEHLALHGGNWKNMTCGELIIR